MATLSQRSMHWKNSEIHRISWKLYREVLKTGRKIREFQRARQLESHHMPETGRVWCMWPCCWEENDLSPPHCHMLLIQRHRKECLIDWTQITCLEFCKKAGGKSEEYWPLASQWETGTLSQVSTHMASPPNGRAGYILQDDIDIWKAGNNCSGWWATDRTELQAPSSLQL